MSSPWIAICRHRIGLTGRQKDQVLARADSQPLHRFMELTQVRHVAPILRDGMRVAEISVDEVTVEADTGRDHYYELEIEIKEQGSEADLTALIGAVQSQWKLPPQPRSKFERALTFVMTSNKRTM